MSENKFEQQSLFEEAPLPLLNSEKKRAKFLAPISPVVLQKVWDFYLKTHFEGKRGLKPRLTEDRVRLITMAVNEFGSEAVLDAIRGCSLSDWHMGRNPRSRVYNTIELILRDSEHVEMFARLTVAEDSRGGFLDD